MTDEFGHPMGFWYQLIFSRDDVHMSTICVFTLIELSSFTVNM